MAQGQAREKNKIIEALKPLFKLGYSVTKACKYAGVPQSTVATWITNDEELRLKISIWQNEINIAARKNWSNEINQGSYQASKEWLAAKESDEFQPKQKLIHVGDEENPIAVKYDFENMSVEELQRYLAGGVTKASKD